MDWVIPTKVIGEETYGLPNTSTLKWPNLTIVVIRSTASSIYTSKIKFGNTSSIIEA